MKVLSLYNELCSVGVSLYDRFIIITYECEFEIQNVLYTFCCKINRYKFERREKETANACILITKTGFHPLSKLLAYLSDSWTFYKTGLRHSWSNSPFSFEIYELDCPKKFPEGFASRIYYKKKIDNCRYCGRCLEIQKSDKKIVGKF